MPNYPLPEPLLLDIQNGMCLPFIGAGLSLNAQLDEAQMPDWQQLGNILRSKLPANMETLSPSDIAKAFERQFGRVYLINTIKSALHSSEAKPGKSHLALAKLPFDIIYTTNFDLLLERAYSSISPAKSFRRLVGERQLAFHAGRNEVTIIKMHGDIDHVDHIIVTSDDYNNYLKDYSAMLIMRTPLFIGYSREDLNFKQIETIVTQRLGRFIKMPYVIQFNLTGDQCEEGFDNHIHIINLETNGRSKDETLAEYFDYISSTLIKSVSDEIRTKRPDIFEDISLSATDDLAIKENEAIIASTSTSCYISMPTDGANTALYFALIRPTLEKVGLEAVRVEEVAEHLNISEVIKSLIRQSRLFIGILTGNDQNIIYEIHLARSMNKKIIVFANEEFPIPFDLHEQANIIYYTKESTYASLEVLLRTNLTWHLQEQRLREAKEFIEEGRYVESIACISMVLEFAIYDLFYTQAKNPKKRTPNGTVGLLESQNIISSSEAVKLREFFSWRSIVLHHNPQVTKERALECLTYVQEFLNNYSQVNFNR